MFEKLFSYQAVIQRHRADPLAAEREAFLALLEGQGMAHATLLRTARYCRCLSASIQSLSAGGAVEVSTLDALLGLWADGRTSSGRASSPKWPWVNARSVAVEFLRFLGLLPAPPSTALASKGFDHELKDFIATKQLGPWLSPVTCKSQVWQIQRFLLFLEQSGMELKDVTPTTVDAFFELMGHRWSRSSLRSSATALRSWFAHCEARGWVMAGVAASILIPRVYRQEGIPKGPPWDVVSRMLADTLGNDPPELRDHAVLLLLAVYGLRSGEVRRLQLDDVNWRIRVVRSKSGRAEWLPLEPSVGNALARYLRSGRPASVSRAVFLTLRAPHRPLSAHAIYWIVRRQFQDQPQPEMGRGPHGLRHACARHLIEAGLSFKETGDHLGHRSPDSTRIYAKVDLASLRRVAFSSLGGLS